MSALRERLRKEFRDEEYRHAYADSFLNTTLAAQIEFLREQRNLTQEELGALAGMKQSAISRAEDVDYSNWSVRTLRKLARAFDLVLNIRFESFGEFLERVESTSRGHLERLSFSDDLAFVDTVRGETSSVYRDVKETGLPDRTFRVTRVPQTAYVMDYTPAENPPPTTTTGVTRVISKEAPC